jgi:hypothetical protein
MEPRPTTMRRGQIAGYVLPMPAGVVARLSVEPAGAV